MLSSPRTYAPAAGFAGRGLSMGRHDVSPSGAKTFTLFAFVRPRAVGEPDQQRPEVAGADPFGGVLANLPKAEATDDRPALRGSVEEVSPVTSFSRP